MNHNLLSEGGESYSQKLTYFLELLQLTHFFQYIF
jgi:hypothetical protein